MSCFMMLQIRSMGSMVYCCVKERAMNRIKGLGEGELPSLESAATTLWRLPFQGHARWSPVVIKNSSNSNASR